MGTYRGLIWRVLPNLDAAIATLDAICCQDSALVPQRLSLETFFAGDRLVSLHTEKVFAKFLN